MHLPDREASPVTSASARAILEAQVLPPFGLAERICGNLEIIAESQPGCALDSKSAKAAFVYCASVNGKRNLHGASDFIGASADCTLFSWMSAHVQHERIATIGRAANASRAMRLP